MLIYSDTHHGHDVGLTPTKYNPMYDSDHPKYELSKFRQVLYDWTTVEMSKLKPFDIAVGNGDLVDGKGEASGGTEQITTDRAEQIQMAKHFITWIGAKENYLTYGTSYHTGKGEDWEGVLARNMNIPIQDVLDLEVNGKTFNFRHHNSRSGIPHGRATPILKEVLWNQLEALQGEYPHADAIIRSHVHYSLQVKHGFDPYGISTPALQGYGSKYGERRVSGTVHYGFIVCDVYDDGEMKWTTKLCQMPARKAIQALAE
jgi:hypothetical protein